ncbi:MAG: GNAT family N-acetyltransferase [Rhizobiaceae bacterium]
MQLTSGHNGQESDIIDLFTTTFSASEGAEEGKVIGQFVTDLIQTTPQQDLYVFSAHQGDVLAGCIFFSRLLFQLDKRTVFILSPVAVRTDMQKQGTGQKLIAFGLDGLRREGVDIAVTYGDPDYYSKVGFAQISEDTASAPQKLQYPHGWLGQNLNGGEIKPLAGASDCVPALNNPDLW